MTTREKLELVSQMDSFLRDCCRDAETEKDLQKLDAVKLAKLRAFKKITDKNRGGNDEN